MHINLKLTSEGDRFDACDAAFQARALVLAIADLLNCKKRLATHELVPTFSPGAITVSGELDPSNSLFESRGEIENRLMRAASLLNSAEQLLSTSLADRSLAPDARLPIQVVHSPTLCGLLEYDPTKDVIKCQFADWAELIEGSISLFKVLTHITIAGMLPQLEIDDIPLALPDIGAKTFRHGKGPGHLKISAGLVSGLYQVANEIEIRIEGHRANCALRAQLSDAARRAALEYRPPFTAAVRYSETAPQLPLLPMETGKLFIEKMWDFEEQAELPLI